MDIYIYIYIYIDIYVHIYIYTCINIYVYIVNKSLVKEHGTLTFFSLSSDRLLGIYFFVC